MSPQYYQVVKNRYRHASHILKGIEMIHAIYKRKRSQIPDFSFSTYKELQQLFRTA